MIAAASLAGSVWALPAPATASSPSFANVTAFRHHGDLAYVARGALYVLDGGRGRVRRVVAQGASGPQFSPNGRWLAFSAGGSVAVTSATGTGLVTIGLHGGSWAWLPDGDLLAGAAIDSVTAGGGVVRVSRAPAGLVAWSPTGDRFVFVVTSRRAEPHGSYRGVERIEVAGSLTGRWTTWYSRVVSFSPSGGFVGSSVARVVVLPRDGGLLVWLDPDDSASLAADGLEVYDLVRQGAALHPLAVTVGDTVSLAADGALAVGAGPDRYAWLTKHVLSCPTPRHCFALPTPHGTLGIDPAISPDGRRIAFVEARAQTSGDFDQASLVRWYATHRLYLTTAGTRRVEVAGSVGAADPVWSANGESILFVAEDYLDLIGRLGERPVRIAGPLLPPSHWPTYYGQVDWTQQFAWSLAAGSGSALRSSSSEVNAAANRPAAASS